MLRWKQIGLLENLHKTKLSTSTKTCNTSCQVQWWSNDDFDLWNDTEPGHIFELTMNFSIYQNVLNEKIRTQPRLKTVT